LPGSPIRGPEPTGPSALAARIAGSFRIASSPNADDDEINAFSVGCEGIVGSVGDGSRPNDNGTPPGPIPFAAGMVICSGMVPFRLFPVPLRKLLLAIRA